MPTNDPTWRVNDAGQTPSERRGGIGANRGGAGAGAGNDNAYARDGQGDADDLERLECADARCVRALLDAPPGGVFSPESADTVDIVVETFGLMTTAEEV